MEFPKVSKQQAIFCKLNLETSDLLIKFTLIIVPVTDTELSVLSEALWQADVNNVANLITINLQGYTTARGRDNAPQP